MKYIQNKKYKEFNLVSNEIDSLYHEIALKLGLSDSAYEILNAVSVLGEDVTQAKICKNSCITKQTVNSSIKQLEKNGFLILNSSDGRESKIELTTKGKKFVRDNIIPIERIEAEILDEMTENEYAELVRLMRKYLTIYREKLEKLDLK